MAVAERYEVQRSCANCPPPTSAYSPAYNQPTWQYFPLVGHELRSCVHCNRMMCA